MNAQGASHNTIKARVRCVQKFGEAMGTTAPEDAVMDDVIDHLAALDVGASSKATYYSHLNAWFTWLISKDYRDDNPMMRMRAPKAPQNQPRPVTDRELDAILSTRMHRRTRMMLYLAAFQGLRVHEIAKMRGEDVNLLDGLLRVKGKGGKVAELQLHPMVAEMAAGFPRRGYWFPSYNGNHVEGGPVLPRSVSNILCQVFFRAGVQGGAHRLRHWHATKLLEEGVDVRTVQVLLRHSSLSTTALYLRVNAKQQRTAINTLKMPDKPEVA
jgi:integrase/recombinase XerD